MASAQDYDTLTRVGPGTPMGSLMRRYWIPAAMSEEFSEPGGAPVRVKLLGEQLVAFRDPQGKVGLVREFCPHRGASLLYARNEEGGLRCLYHGWKVAQDGAIVETPAEPPGSTMASRICHTAYPTREAGGMLWAYMGPRELEPPFPNYSWLDLKPPHLLIVKMHQDCNYLQGVEGEVDPCHPNYLHRELKSADDRGWNGAGWQSIGRLMYDGAPRLHCEETAFSMRMGAVRRTADAGISYVRLTECIAPFYCYVATGPGETQLFKAWHPIDDHSSFSFYVHFDPDRPLDAESIYENWGHRTAPPDYKTPYTTANMHGQDRAGMLRTYSGIHGAAIQDLALQESMGAIYDHTQEHLASSDKAVVFYRRRMLQLIRANQEGKPLPATSPGLDFRLPIASCYMPSDRPWQEAVRWQRDEAWQAQCDQRLKMAMAAE